MKQNKYMIREDDGLTERQVEVCAHLDSMGQLHLVDEEIREKYLSALRYFQVVKSGIEFVNRGGK